MANDLELRHCRVLLALSEHGGVGAAARALGLAQSTVSETLLSLERLIGAPMTIRRRGQEAALTVTASALLPHARALISASEAAIAAVTTGSRGTIRLGSVESASSLLLPPVLAAFRSQWPMVEVRVTIGLCDELRKRVRAGELDAAITVDGLPDGPADRDGYIRTLSPARLVLFMSSRRSPGPGSVKQSDLARRPLLVPDPDGAFTSMLRAWFSKSGDTPRIESAGSISGVKIGVRTGDVVGVLPSYAVAAELDSGEFVALTTEEPLPSIALGLAILQQPVAMSPLHDMIRRIEAVAKAIEQAPSASRAPRGDEVVPTRRRTRHSVQ